MSTAYAPIVDRPVRWGLLGAGSIAPALARAVASTPGGEVVAVAARDLGRARALADEHGVPRAYGSYAELCADPEVDVVYISSTHPHHAAQALDCLAAGKHVLVEKPITLTVRDTEAVLDRARSRGLFAMEAMWTRCLPLVRELVQRVGAGEVGRVRSVAAAFTVPFGYDESHRLFDLANGGGALMDLGVYPVTLAHLLAGHPTDVQVLGTTVPSGADDQVGVQWRSDRGVLVQVLCDSQSHGASRTVVRGSQGWIEVHGPVNDPESFTVHREGARPEEVRGERRGFAHQVEEVHRCLREGLVESSLVPHEASISVMTVLESVRRELGVRYPQEEEPLRA